MIQPKLWGSLDHVLTNKAGIKALSVNTAKRSIFLITAANVNNYLLIHGVQ